MEKKELENRESNIDFFLIPASNKNDPKIIELKNKLMQYSKSKRFTLKGNIHNKDMQHNIRQISYCDEVVFEYDKGKKKFLVLSIDQDELGYLPYKAKEILETDHAAYVALLHVELDDSVNYADIEIFYNPDIPSTKYDYIVNICSYCGIQNLSVEVTNCVGCGAPIRH